MKQDSKDERKSGEMDEKNPTKKRRKVLANFSTLCVVWLFEFTAYSGLQNLQASLNADIGLISLTAITVGGVISCLVAPTLISYIGSKGALILSCLCVCIYVAANYYPKPYVLITAGAIIGLSTGMMWTAQSCYVTDISMEYQNITGEKFDAVLSRLFGIFFVFFQSTQVWGNLMSSAVLQNGYTTKQQTNNSFCGPNFCPWHQNSRSGNVTENEIILPEDNLQKTLISIYLGCSLIGLITVVFFLQPIKSGMHDKYSTFKERLKSNVRILLTDLNMALLVPFGLFVGIEQTVMFAQFTNAYVACKLGVSWIGYTMLCFGASNTLGSLLVGVLGKYTGRLSMFIFSFLLNIGTMAFMRFWSWQGIVPFPVFFIVPALWGICDAIWHTQSDALVGSAFHDNPEPAFANYLMFQAVGASIGYFYNVYVCEAIKLYIVSALMVVSVMLLMIIEIRLRRKSKST